jgi:hypothetical protein
VDLQQALTTMKAAGIRMRARGDRLSVASRAPLTNQQRAWIRAHKAELLQLLADSVPNPPRVGNDDAAAMRRIREGWSRIPDIPAGESGEATGLPARHAMCVYRYRLTDKPDAWLTMIAPDCDLDEARRSLHLRFGERLTAVVEHRYRKAPR